MATRNVNLTEHYHRFIEDQVLSGRFQNASEVVRAGLHLLEQQVREEQEKLALLRALAQEGLADLDHGRGVVLQGEDEVARFVSAVGRRAR